MKTTLLSAILGCGAIALSACDKKTETTAVSPAPPVAPVAPAPVIPPGEIFSDAGATDFLKEYKGYFNNISEALKTGDTSKLQPLMAKGGELVAKGKDLAAKLKPEEIKAYKDKLSEYAKPMREAAVKLSAGALDKIKSLEAAGRERLENLKNKLATPADPAVPNAPAVPVAPDAPVAPAGEAPAAEPNAN